MAKSGSSLDSASDSPIRLIVGLGNPGKKYDKTRHNVGFDIVDRLVSDRGLDWKPEKKWKTLLARTGDGVLAFAKPQTFMNLSGEAVIKVCSFFKIPPAEVLVIYDDADLPLGRLRMRASGSAGGHNGMKSLIQHFGTDRFPRLKFGIGRSSAPGEPQRKMIGHVLGRFESDEVDTLEKNMARATEAVNYALSEGLSGAMTRFNQNPEPPPKPSRPKKTSRESHPDDAPTPNPSDSTASESDRNDRIAG